MKTLYIVRHAKSSWDDPNIDDFERPLNERGKKDAPRMGKRLKEKDIHPDLLLSSPARRAFSTAKRIAEALDFDKKNIKTESKLYHATEDSMLDVIHDLKDKHDVVMLFGHNPGLTDFVNSIIENGQSIPNVPTCGVAGLRFQVDQWENITWGTGSLLFFDYPKSQED